MKLSATYTLDGVGEQTVTTRPVDVVQWEVATKRKIGDGKGLGFEDMTRIVYLAAKRCQQIPADQTYDAFLNGLEDFQPEAADPTLPRVEVSPGP